MWIISASVSGDETGRILLCYSQGAVFSSLHIHCSNVDMGFYYFFYPKDDSIIRGQMCIDDLLNANAEQYSQCKSKWNNVRAITSRLKY